MHASFTYTPDLILMFRRLGKGFRLTQPGPEAWVG